MIISDEIYKVFVYDGAEHQSVASLNEDAREHGGGVRLQQGLCHDRLAPGLCGRAKGIDRRHGRLGQSHAAGNPNSLAQYAGLAAMEDSHVTDDIVAAYLAAQNHAGGA